MASRQVHYVADREDIVTAITRVEKALQVKYVDAWAKPTLTPVVFESLIDWPQLGASENGRATGFFLVVPKTTRVHLQRLDLYDGTVQYTAKPLDHPKSIIMEVSGVFTRPDNAIELAVGKIGTALQSPESIELYGKFRRLFLKGFVCQQQSLWIGAGAQVLMGNGAKVNW